MQYVSEKHSKEVKNQLIRLPDVIINEILQYLFYYVSPIKPEPNCISYQWQQVQKKYGFNGWPFLAFIVPYLSKGYQELDREVSKQLWELCSKNEDRNDIQLLELCFYLNLSYQVGQVSYLNRDQNQQYESDTYIELCDGIYVNTQTKTIFAQNQKRSEDWLRHWEQENYKQVMYRNLQERFSFDIQPGDKIYCDHAIPRITLKTTEGTFLWDWTPDQQDTRPVKKILHKLWQDTHHLTSSYLFLRYLQHGIF